MSDTREAVQQIESALADLLDVYAGLREKYIRDPDDFRALKGSERDIAIEVATYQNAARLLREHRDEAAGMGLPSWLWDEWSAKERETCARLAEFLVVPRAQVPRTEYGMQYTERASAESRVFKFNDREQAEDEAADFRAMEQHKGFPVTAVAVSRPVLPWEPITEEGPHV